MTSGEKLSPAHQEWELIHRLQANSPLMFDWSEVSQADRSGILQGLLDGRLLFQDPAILDVMGRWDYDLQTARMWLKRTDLSSVMRKKFEDQVEAHQGKLTAAASQKYCLSGTDLELLIICREAQREGRVIGFRYPFQFGIGIAAASVECARSPYAVSSGRPVHVCAPLGSSIEAILGLNTGRATVESLVTWDRLGRVIPEDLDEEDILEVRHPATLLKLWDVGPPSVAVVHVPWQMDPSVASALVSGARNGRFGLVLVLSPASIQLTEQLRAQALPCWGIPKALLRGLESPSGERSPSGLARKVPLDVQVAVDGWRLHGLALSDDQLNWASQGLLDLLLGMSEGLALEEDGPIQRVLSAAWGILGGLEGLAAPIAVYDQVATQTRWSSPLSTRLDRLNDAVEKARFDIPEKSRKLSYLSQLVGLLFSRLSDGRRGRPAAVAQLVSRAAEGSQPVLVVACSGTMAKATDAFINIEMERRGLEEKAKWVVVTVTEATRSKIGDLLELQGRQSLESTLACIPTCRHSNHTFLLGLPLAQRVVSFLYQSQAHRYATLCRSVIQDDLQAIHDNRVLILRPGGSSHLVHSLADLQPTNVSASPPPSFPQGSIVPEVGVSDILAEVSAEMRSENKEEDFQAVMEAQAGSMAPDPGETPATDHGGPQSALCIFLEGGLCCLVTPSHRVFKVDTLGGEVGPTTGGQLRAGEKILAVSGSVQYSPTRLLLHELAARPEWSIQVRYRLMWVETLQGWMESTKTTTSQFLEELKKHGSSIRTEEAIRFWLDGDVVIGPRDPEDIRRIADICGAKRLRRFASMVISSVESLREVHQRVKDAVVQAALQGRVSRIDEFGQSAIAIDAGEVDQVERFLRDVSIHRVVSVGPLRNVESNKLNKIGRL